MKVLLTGATGLIGGEVLTQCLNNTSITSIVTLTRRPLSTTHPKLTQITHTDFTSYPAELLADIDACIFALGIALAKTAEDGVRINQKYPLAAARAFVESTKGKKGGKVRFVYVSGALVEKDQTKSLWLLSGMRKMRGVTETKLLKLNSLSDSDSGTEVKIVRPGFVGSKEGSIKDLAVGVFAKVIKVDVLAKAIVDIAVNGGSEITEMDELIAKGKSAG